MSAQAEEKRTANELRKSGKYEEALDIYNRLWKNENDAYVGAGILHCLRKLDRYNEAVVLADRISRKYPDAIWCRTEIIWTYIKGKLRASGKDIPLREVKAIATKILQMNPEPLPMKIAVFSVLKVAKENNDWKTVDQWLAKLDPDSLSAEPMTDKTGRQGWSDQALWFNYRINAFLENENFEDVIKTVDDIIEKFPKQRKFFLRLKALANYKLGNLEESEKIYRDLCRGRKADWWLIHELAKAVRDLGRKEEALQLMYTAAQGSSKLESLVNLFEEIGILCRNLEHFAEARAHLALSKHVRSKQGWSTSEKLNNGINKLNTIIGDSKEPASIKEALKICKSTWQSASGSENNSNVIKGERHQNKKGLKGKLTLGPSDRLYCFINTKDKQAYFCLKKDLPKDITDGCIVIFDAIPSYDRKKQRDAWKATNIRIKK